MAREDYGAINVISEEEREILGIGGSKKPQDEEEALFETIGKAGDKIGETQVGKKIGTILTVIMLAILSGGANSGPTDLSEQDLYDLERQSLIKLIQSHKTRDRIHAMLSTGRRIKN